MFDRFGDGFESGKVNDEVKMGFFEKLVELVSIEEVDLVELGFGAGKFFDVVKNRYFAIDEIVDDFDGVALVQ